MNITHEINGTVGLVTLTRKLDFNCRKIFLSTIEHVLEQPIWQIVIDLSHVPLMDSVVLAHSKTGGDPHEGIRSDGGPGP